MASAGFAAVMGGKKKIVCRLRIATNEGCLL